MNVPGALARRAAALAAQNRLSEAYDLLLRGIECGDPHAAATLADWRMSGQLVRRDLAEARLLYGKALSLGLDKAAGPYVALLATGAGNSGRRWEEAVRVVESRRSSDPIAREQLAVLEAMRLSADGESLRPFQRRTLFQDPAIEELPGFLTAAECLYLQGIAMARLAPALIVDPRTGALRPDPVRLAQAAAFPFVTEDLVLHAVNRRIAAASGTAWEQGEPAQVLAYAPGDEYRLHSDALPAGNNQRITTFLIALNADYDGGETSFPALGLEWRGKAGDALMFRNVGLDGLALPSARHAGRPVMRGRKFLFSRWIRERPIDLSGPPGRPF